MFFFKNKIAVVRAGLSFIGKFIFNAFSESLTLLKLTARASEIEQNRSVSIGLNLKNIKRKHALCILLFLLSTYKVHAQCTTISNVSFYTSSINSCLVPQTVSFYPQYKIDQSPLLLQTTTVSFTSKKDIDFPMDKNGCVYMLKVSGGFTLWNSNDYLDAYAKYGYNANQFQYVDGTFLDFLSLTPDSGPTAYNPSHVYYLYFTGNATKLNYKFTDNKYSDNSGSLTFEWYVIPCFSYSWDFGNGNTSTDSTGIYTYSSPGTYVTTYTVYDEVNKCKESYSSSLTIYPSYTTSVTQQICVGQSITMGTSVYSQTGNYTDTLKTMHGCDSIVYLKLDVLTKKKLTVDTTICSGQGFNVGTSTYTQSGNYIDTLISVQGCDSIVNLTLTIATPSTVYIDTAICNGNTFIVGTNSYSSSGTYVNTFSTSLGCDSVVNLTLTVVDSLLTTIEQFICEGESYLLGTTVYTSSGFYSQTFMSSNGCDSIVELYLTVLDTTITTISTSICQGDAIEMAGIFYDKTGFYSDTLFSMSGCDSIINLNLTVKDSSITYEYTAICEGEAHMVGSSFYTSSGNYTNTFQTINACDSIVITYLTVHAKPEPLLGEDLSVCAGEILTLSPGAFANYSWSNGSVDAVIEIQEAGSYYVMVSDSNLCSAVDSIEVYEGDCSTLFVPNSFTPNKDGLNDYFTAIGSNIEAFNLQLFDYWGSLIFETTDYATAANEAKGWDGRNAQEGIYIWLISYKSANGRGYVTTKRAQGKVSLIR